MAICDIEQNEMAALACMNMGSDPYVRTNRDKYNQYSANGFGNLNLFSSKKLKKNSQYNNATGKPTSDIVGGKNNVEYLTEAPDTTSNVAESNTIYKGGRLTDKKEGDKKSLPADKAELSVMPVKPMKDDIHIMVNKKTLLMIGAVIFVGVILYNSSKS